MGVRLTHSKLERNNSIIDKLNVGMWPNTSQAWIAAAQSIGLRRVRNARELPLRVCNICNVLLPVSRCFRHTLLSGYGQQQ
jgi:hypothetical protein